MANVDNPDRPDQKTGQNPQSQGQSQKPQTQNQQSATQSGNQGSGLESKGPSNVQGSSSRSTGQSSAGSSGQGNYSFRCADAGYKECNWQTHGSSPDEVMRNVEQHGRQQHNLTNLDDETRNKVRSNIRQAA
jgi:predicted small metal-binding protein